MSEHTPKKQNNSILSSSPENNLKNSTSSKTFPTEENDKESSSKKPKNDIDTIILGLPFTLENYSLIYINEDQNKENITYLKGDKTSIKEGEHLLKMQFSLKNKNKILNLVDYKKDLETLKDISRIDFIGIYNDLLYLQYKFERKTKEAFNSLKSSFSVLNLLYEEEHCDDDIGSFEDISKNLKFDDEEEDTKNYDSESKKDDKFFEEQNNFNQNLDKIFENNNKNYSKKYDYNNNTLNEDEKKDTKDNKDETQIIKKNISNNIISKQDSQKDTSHLKIPQNLSLNSKPYNNIPAHNLSYNKFSPSNYRNNNMVQTALILQGIQGAAVNLMKTQSQIAFAAAALNMNLNSINYMNLNNNFNQKMFPGYKNINVFNMNNNNAYKIPIKEDEKVEKEVGKNNGSTSGSSNNNSASKTSSDSEKEKETENNKNNNNLNTNNSTNENAKTNNNNSNTNINNNNNNTNDQNKNKPPLPKDEPKPFKKYRDFLPTKKEKNIEFHTNSTRDYQFKYVSRYIVQIENEKNFPVTKMLIGNNGMLLRNIILENCIKNGDYTTKIRLRGKGSGYKEGPNNEESQDPMELCISSLNFISFTRCTFAIEAILSKVYYQYFLYQCNGKENNYPTMKKILKYQYTVNRYNTLAKEEKRRRIEEENKILMKKNSDNGEKINNVNENKK